MEQELSHVHVTDIDAAVGGSVVAVPMEVLRVVHRLATVEEHCVRHRREVFRGNVIGILAVDVEGAFDRWILQTAKSRIGGQDGVPTFHQSKNPLGHIDTQ